MTSQSKNVRLVTEARMEAQLADPVFREAIKGDPGDPGPQGERGIQGLPGLDAVPQAEGMAAHIEAEGPVRTALNAATAQVVAPVVDALAAQRVPTRVKIPAEVGLVTPISIARTRDGFLTDVDPESHHITPTGPTYYVDPVNGSNANDGLTRATALADPYYANATNGSNAGEIVIIADGIWPRTQSITGIRSKHITYRTDPGVRAVFVVGDRLTWTAQGSHFTASVASCNGVLDARHLDAYGDPRELTKVGTAAEVDATPGTYIFTSGILHVRLHDSGTPNQHVYASRPVNSLAYGTAVAGAGDGGSTYIEGIEWWGGSTANLTAPGAGWRFLARDCAWNFAGTGNGLSVTGMALSILHSCEASNNNLDGFNYHATGTLTGEVIEVNCIGRNNGRVGGSNNGSSAHENYRIVRVGGDYIDNQGANVADVNNTRSFNAGCTAGGSTDYRQDFYVNGTSRMWVHSCIATSERALTAVDSAIIQTRDTLTAGTVTGNVTGY